MSRHSGRLSSFALPAAVAAILLLLGLLATVQYRWAGELSEAERVRLDALAKSRAEALSLDVDREVTRVWSSLQMSPGVLAERAFGPFADRYEAWRRSAAHPSLVREVYLIEHGGEGVRLARYDAPSRTFTPAPWQPALEPLRSGVDAVWRPPGASRERPPWRPEFVLGSVPALLVPVFEPHLAGEPPPGPRDVRVLHFRDAHGSRSPPGRARHVREERAPPPGLGAGAGRPSGGEVRVRGPWPPGGPERFGHPGMVVVVLDPGDLLPALVERHFGAADGVDYDVSVVQQDDRRRVVWQSRAGVDPTRVPDAATGLLDLRLEELGARDRPGFPGPRARTEDTGAWRLQVARREAPLDQVVGAHRRRNLAVGFGILLLLGASVGLVVVSSQRARLLAERQMEFVAAVSHELRTPVSVICSTAENLADGVVSDPAQVRVYGGVLRDEGRRLGQMVEQVLEFAGTVRRGARPHLEELAVGSVVDGALEAFAGPLEAAGFTIVKDVAPDLPAVRGDAFALRRALQNLIENVLKYGAGGRWLGVRAAAGDGGREVHVTVEDRGQGIAPSDLPGLFEPFVRGNAARAAQARGFGLGLALVRRVAEHHGGSVTVDSVPGRGSAFTLRLPATPRAAPSPEATDALPHPSR